MVNVHDICLDADLFRAAYPHWPSPEPEPLGVITGQGEDSCTAERPIVRGWLRCNRESGHSEFGHLDGRTNRIWGLPDEGCDWANELSRKQRAVLAEKLARACKCSYAARTGLAMSDEMAALHLDITERAEVATS